VTPADRARAEAIVAETWPWHTVVWRVVTADELADVASLATAEDAAPPCVTAWALEQRGIVASWSGRRRWPPAQPADVRALAPCAAEWPALRALAALGAHLVGLDAGRVTLAVEAP
jgi:hypothetical protein